MFSNSSSRKLTPNSSPLPTGHILGLIEESFSHCISDSSQEKDNTERAPEGGLELAAAAGCLQTARQLGALGLAPQHTALWL